MQLGNTVHFNSFKWVKEELRQLLMDVQRQLEEYVNFPEDEHKLDEIIAELRQIRGTLSLVEIYGAALLSEEMEMVARALKSDEISNRDNAFEVLLSASIKLPDYLDSLAAGNKDVPMVLLPLLNDLRACRNAQLLSENVLFFPDVASADDEVDYDHTGEVEAVKIEESSAELARKSRHAYQLGLLGWFRNDNTEEAFRRMRKVIKRLRLASDYNRSKRLWWVAETIVESLSHSAVEGSVALKSLMGKVDRQVKTLADQGEENFVKALPDELTKNLLYYVARSEPATKKIKQVQQQFNLNKYLPTEDDMVNAERRLGGPNQELLDRVADAIQEDINQAKDSLEVYLHGSRDDFDQLESLLPVFAKVADTLGMLGLGRARENILLERSQLEASVTAKTEPSEDALMSAASALLGIETELEAYVDRRMDAAIMSTEPAANDAEESAHEVAENQRVIGSLVNEALKNIMIVKDAFLNYIDKPGHNDVLEHVPAVLDELSGAMFVSPLDEARSIITGLRDYFIDSLIGKQRDPGATEQDVFADVVTNIECFLESVAENRFDSELYVSSGHQALGRLQAYADGTVSDEVIGDLGSDLQSLADDLKLEVVDGEDIESGQDPLIEDVDQPVVKPQARPQPKPAEKNYDNLQIIGEDADEEIIEVFIEEAVEELAKVSGLFPSWRENPSDREALTTIRRSFHTLKGSGRLIGATVIGEFAWSMENMMNRVIDGAIKESEEVLSTIEESIAVLPQLIEQIRGNQQPVENLIDLMQQADRVAAGQEARSGYEPTKTGVHEVLANAQEDEDAAPKPLNEAAGLTASTTIDELSETHVIDQGDGALPGLDELSGDDEYVFNINDIAEESDDGTAVILDDEDELLIPAADETLLSASVDDLPEGAADETLLIQVEDSANDDDLVFEGFDLETGSSIDGDDAIIASDDVAEVRGPTDSDAAKSLGFEDELGLNADPALLEIFSEEAETHIAILEGISEKAKANAMTSKDVEALIRSLHTLHGSARTAKFLNIAEKAKLLEDHANNLSEMGRSWHPEEIDLLDRTVVYVRQCVSHLRAHTQEIIIDESLVKDLEDCAERSDAELDKVHREKVDKTGRVEPIELDTELVEIFLEEGPEIVSGIEHNLQDWKKGDFKNPEYIMDIMRQLHTLKGSARMASLSDVGDLSHVLESLFIAVSSDKLPSSEAVAAMLTDAVDRLMGMMDVLAQGRFPTIPKDYLQKLEDVRLWKIEPEDTVAVKLKDVESRLAEDNALEDDLSRTISIEQVDQGVGLPENFQMQLQTADAPGQSEVEQMPAAAPQQEQIRVRADKLDNLVNFAGEVNIYHSRMGQHVTDIRFNLGELEQTVSRLRSQLRDMEIQTEAQIASRMEREHENPYEDFDPLEMDRYSHMQQLSRSLAESASDLDSIGDILSELVQNSEMVLQQQSRISTDLQEELLQTRMVRFQGLASRLRRIVRQTALQLDKKVELTIVGAEHEIDRSVQERMLAPLEHMLRNAVYHGIEKPDQRSAIGKSETGTIRLDVDRDGSYIILNVADDGAGIDVNRIRRKALDQGLMGPDDEKSDYEVMQYILHEGFTTAEGVSQIAGRGVGLDVVDNEIKQLGGSLTINSEVGRGTIFSIRLPLTLAINQALLVQLFDDVHAIPLTSIEGVALLSRQEVEENLMGRRKTYEYAENNYDMHYLGSLLGLGLPSSLAAEGQYPLLLIRSGTRRVAVHVDAMLGRREIVVKPVGPQITVVPGISGATILADGRVALILDVAGLMATEISDTSFRSERTTLPFNKPDDELTVMVVDDSITIRKVTARILGRHKLKVITAKDGLDAVQQLQDVTPDLFLMDIEMPRMDGFELATHVRSDARLQGIPIIMITSRTGEKHRDRAKQIGVDRYLGKPFQENELMEEINVLLERKESA